MEAAADTTEESDRDANGTGAGTALAPLEDIRKELQAARDDLAAAAEGDAASGTDTAPEVDREEES